MSLKATRNAAIIIRSTSLVLQVALLVKAIRTPAEKCPVCGRIELKSAAKL